MWHESSIVVTTQDVLRGELPRHLDNWMFIKDESMSNNRWNQLKGTSELIIQGAWEVYKWRLYMEVGMRRKQRRTKRLDDRSQCCLETQILWGCEILGPTRSTLHQQSFSFTSTVALPSQDLDCGTRFQVPWRSHLIDLILTQNHCVHFHQAVLIVSGAYEISWEWKVCCVVGFEAKVIAQGPRPRTRLKPLPRSSYWDRVLGTRTSGASWVWHCLSASSSLIRCVIARGTFRA
jgi:hypothetical protein